MNEEILISRREVTRRRALAIGGTVSLSGFLAACGSEKSEPSAAARSAGSDLANLLDAAPSCVMSLEQTQGPYWFDVDSIRDDLREDRPGARLDLALRVQDLSECKGDGIARFTTIYPGWYAGRTVHIHLKVHIDKKTILTTQLFFDEKLTSAVFLGVINLGIKA